MHAADILKYGNRTLLTTLEGVPAPEWTRSGVCGVWSVKDIIAHLASFEHVLVEILYLFLEGRPTPYLEKFQKYGVEFNDRLVALSAGKTADEVLADYRVTHAEVMELIVRVPAEILTQTGTMPWYGIEYALDDLLVYMYYGHKREHSAQIAVFKDLLAEEARETTSGVTS